MDNLNKTVSPEFKKIGDVFYLLGETNDELGASEYYKLLAKENKNSALGGSVPQVDFKKNIKIYSVLENAIEKELVASAMSVNSGGLGIALSKACVGGMVGCDVSIKHLLGNAKGTGEKLFSESQGRILVSISPKNVSAFETLVKNIPHTKLGKTTKNEKVVINDTKKIVETNVKKLHKIYHSFSNKMQ
jgi:phosphoribosylformylglycinamidine synthase